MRSWLRFVGKKLVDRRDRKRCRAASNPAPHLSRPAFDFLEDRITPAGPAVNSIALVDPPVNNASTVSYQVTFDEPVTGVDAGDFALAKTGTTSAAIGSVVGSGAVYTVTVNAVAGDGSLGLNLVPNGTIMDGGNVALTGAPFVGSAYVIDHTLPTATFLTEPATFIATTSTTFTLSGNDPTAGGVSSGVDHLEVRLDGASFAAQASPLNLTNLAEGPHTLAVRAVDAAGNVGTATSYPFTVDLTGPIISTFDGPPDPDPVDTATFTYSFYDDADYVGSGFNHAEVSIDGGPFVTEASPFTTPPESEGRHELQVQAVDNVGNVRFGGTMFWTVAVDTPYVTSFNRSPPTNNGITKAGSLVYALEFSQAVTGVAIKDFTVQTTGALLTGTPILAGSGADYTLTIPAVQGNGSVTVKLIDDDSIVAAVGGIPLGGVGANNGSFTSQQYFVDQMPPTVTILAKPPLLTQSDSAYFEVTDSDSTAGAVTSGIDQVQFQLDGGAFRTMTRNYFDTATHNTASLTGVSNGVHTFGVESVDGAGNISNEATYTWTVDNVPPSVQSIVQSTPTNTTTNAASITYTVKFSEPVTGVDFSDFKATQTGSAAASVTGVVGSGATYLVTIHDSGTGTVGISLVDDRSIHDAAGNALWSLSAPLSLGSAVTYANAVGGHSVAVGDFNGDGSLDLAFVNPSLSGTNFAVYLGNGDGTLRAGSAAAYVAPFFATVTEADISGDGVDDLIVPFIDDENQIDMMTGNGDGTFAGAQGLGPSTDFVRDIAVADFNSDGTPDYAVIGNAGHLSDPYTLQIVDNVAPPVYFTQTSYAAPGAQRIIAADVNADGIPDLVIADTLSNSVTVFVGNGDSTFQTGVTLAVTHPAGLAVADVDGDGKPDLIATNDTDGTISVFLGIGDGTFQPTAQTFATAGTAYSVQAVDMNGDGKIDLVVGKSAGGALGILRGNGDGTFAAETTYAAVAPSGALGLAIADLNHDGKPDIVSVSDSGSFSVLLNDGSGSIAGPATTVDATPPVIQSILATSPSGTSTNATTITFTATFSESVTGVDSTDFTPVTTGTLTVGSFSVTGNGRIYMIVANAVAGDGMLGFNLVDDHSIRDLLGNPLYASAGPYSVTSRTDDINFYLSKTVAVADFNSDGKLDFAVADPANSLIGVALGNGDGSFPTPTILAGLAGNDEVRTADVNGDGFADLIVASPNNGGEVLFGNGDGTFKAPSAFALDASIVSFAVADFNVDGKPDVIAVSSSNTVDVLLANGDGTFQPRTTFADQFVNSARQLTVADFNNDGKPDVVVLDLAGYQVFLGNGDGTFLKQGGHSATDPVGIAVGDFDGDGNVDIAVATNDILTGSQILVDYNFGNAIFGRRIILPATHASAIAAGDVDNDGRDDIIYSGLATNVLISSGSSFVLPSQTFAELRGVLEFSDDIVVADMNADGIPDIFTQGGNTSPPVVCYASVLLGSDSGNFTGTTILVDHSAPSINQLTTPAGSTNTTSTNISFSAVDTTVGGVTSGLSSVQVSLDGAPFAAATSPFTYTNLAEGSHAFRIEAVDKAGNVSSAMTRTWTIDLTKPTITVTSMPPADSQSSTGTFVFTATDPVSNGVASGLGTGAVEAQIDGHPFVPAASPLVFNGLTVGTHTVQILAADVAQNFTTFSYTWTVDRTDPVVQSIVQTTPSAPSTNAGSITYTVTFNEPVAGVDATDFQLATTGTVVTALPLVGGSGATYTVIVSGIVGDGTVQLKLADDGSIRDLAGNPLAAIGYPLALTQPALLDHSYQGASTAAADFDGDGEPDLAVVDGFGKYVNVRTFLGNGDGTFKIGPSTFANYGAGTVYAADVNGDGKADLVAWGSNQIQGAFVCVLLGNGNGTFKPQQTAALAGGTRSIAIADVNGDGKPDVVGVSYAYDLWVLVGNGDGTFKAPITYPSLSDGTVAIADFNSDGKPDLLVTNGANSRMSLFPGNGDGTFKMPTTMNVATPGSVTLGDVNGDGKMDFAVLAGSAATVFLGNGNGTFKAPHVYPTTDSPSAMAFVDMNGDGKLDLVIGKNRRSNVGILLGNGDGTFGAETDFAVHDWVVGDAALTVVDLNGDGRPDLVTQTEYYPPSFSVLLNTDTGSIAGPTTTIDQTPPTASVASGPSTLTNRSSASFTFNGNDPVAGGVSSGVSHFEVSLDGGLFTTATSPDPLSGLTDGNHTLQVRAVDNAGNVGPASALYAWTVDLTPPTAIVASGPPTESDSSSATFAISDNDPLAGGVSSGVNHLEVSVDGATFTTATSPDVLTGLKDGSHTFQVHAVDNAGNVGPASALYAWTVDLTPPDVALVATPPALSDNATARFAFAAQDPTSGGVSSGVARIEVSLDGAPFITATSPDLLSGLSGGNHTFQARAFDVAGNVSSVVSYAWNINLSATTETIDVTSVALQTSADLAVDNDFTRFASAFTNIQPGDTVVIHGTLDWSEANALASWESYEAGHYSYTLPSVSDVTVTAANLGDGIRGPGDIASGGGAPVSGEGPFRFSAPDPRWTIENLAIANFDTAIGFAPDGAAHDYDGLRISNNTITVAGDDADPGYNAGIFLAASANQTVQGNTINLLATGSATDGSVGIGSSRQSTNDWDNLLLDNNTVNVLSNSAENIVGIDEASGSVGSSIMVSNNKFLSSAAGNDPMANRQVGFGITSESVSATSSHPAATVAYSGNVVEGAHEGFEWGVPTPAGTPGDPAYDWSGPDYLGIVFTNNSLTDVGEGFFAQAGGKGTFSGTTIANDGIWNFGAAFHARGAGSVLRVADPTTNFTGLASLKNEEAGGLVIFTSITATIADVSQFEGNSGATMFSFPVTLTAAPSANQMFTVDYSTANGTADGNDYSTVSGTLTFQPGQASATIAVKVLGDFTPEPDETFFVNLSNPLLTTNGSPAPGQLANTRATGTIQNDDSTAITASIAGASATKSATIGATTLMTFAATLNSAPPAGDYFTVNYHASNGSARGGVDYSAADGTLTFLAGSTTPASPLTVTVLGSPTMNPPETFSVTLDTPLLHFTGLSQTIPGNIGSGTATGTIDSPPPSGAVVSVSSVSKSEGTPVSGNPASNFTTFTFTISYAGTLTTSIKVNWATANGSALGGQDYQQNSGQVTLTPMVASQTLSVTVFADKTREPDETFFLNLTNPGLNGFSNYTFGTATGTGTIVNDD